MEMLQHPTKLAIFANELPPLVQDPNSSHVLSVAWSRNLDWDHELETLTLVMRLIHNFCGYCWSCESLKELVENHNTSDSPQPGSRSKANAANWFLPRHHLGSWQLPGSKSVKTITIDHCSNGIPSGIPVAPSSYQLRHLLISGKPAHMHPVGHSNNSTKTTPSIHGLGNADCHSWHGPWDEPPCF